MSPPDPDPASLVDELKAFVTDALLHGDARGLDATTNLIETGILNSLGLMKLVRFVLDRYGVKVPFKELKPDNVKDLRSIAAMIMRVRATPPR